MADAEQLPVRRAEVLACLSMATDLAMGQPIEFALKSCALAMRFAHQLELPTDQLGHVYHQALLRYVGCNAETHVMAALLGDEIAFRRQVALIDMGRTQEVLSLVFNFVRQANADSGALRMLAGVVGGLASSKAISQQNLASHCEVAQRLSERLRLGEDIRANLGQVYERWDGKGMPYGLKGEAVSQVVQIVTLVQDWIVLEAAFGPEAAKARLLARSGAAYAPGLAESLSKRIDVLGRTVGEATLDDVLALEPHPHAYLDDDGLDEACQAVADFSDLKTPYTVGHSRAVAELAASAARAMGLPVRSVRDLTRAGLLHDIGQVAVPARVWLKTEPLSESEREQIRLHAYFGERILVRPAALAKLGVLVGQHHERVDGTGYHRGSRGPEISMESRILAATEYYQSKLEPRPHRAALAPKSAAEAMKREARNGGLDSEAVQAVLAAAGHTIPAVKLTIAGLTEREIDVLRAIARGRSTKEIGRDLGISPKTADNHTQSIFSKIGVKTRGGATLYAIEHGLANWIGAVPTPAAPAGS